MNLVFFNDAIEHIARLTRILRAPRGNAMLVGMGGSGRQSLARLAAFMSGCQCRQLELNKGYSVREFREDLKKLFMTAGVHRKSVVFLFTDSQVRIFGAIKGGDAQGQFSKLCITAGLHRLTAFFVMMAHW